MSDQRDRLSAFELINLGQEMSSPMEMITDDGETTPHPGLWDNFETSAHSIVMLYRNPNWQTFQTAAAGTTQMYKDSIESERRSFELGVQTGRQRLLKELFGYFRRFHGKSTIRRDDLFAFLAAGRPHLASCQVSRTMGQLHLQSSPRMTAYDHSESPFHLFHEALTLQSAASSSPPRRNRQDLSVFLLDELRQHRKRSHSATTPPQGANSKRSRRF